jgi:CheY-like chemotaxis protein
VLLAADRPGGEEDWMDQFSRLLAPQGVLAWIARSGPETVNVAQDADLDAAVIDLGLSMGRGSSSTGAGRNGIGVLEVLRRLPGRPPVVALRGPAHSRRQAERLLGEALRLGVFAVVEKPVELEHLLGVLQRLMERRYKGAWPERTSGGPSQGFGAADRWCMEGVSS